MTAFEALQFPSSFQNILEAGNQWDFVEGSIEKK